VRQLEVGEAAGWACEVGEHVSDLPVEGKHGKAEKRSTLLTNEKDEWCRKV
jgi:hypothetical protein